MFPFIRFTNWKQVNKSSVQLLTCSKRFHSYASRIGSKVHKTCEQKRQAHKSLFPFIRFTNWKQESFRIDTLQAFAKMFPFIRFTNWKQDPGWGCQLRLDCFHSYASRIGSKHWTLCPLVAYLYRFHSYASRIGSKFSRSRRSNRSSSVSIHTLHELEASFFKILWLNMGRRLAVSIHTLHELEASKYMEAKVRAIIVVSIHTLHELEASLVTVTTSVVTEKVSIHTLHELEASRPEAHQHTGLFKGFHSYASRIGSKQDWYSYQSWKPDWVSAVSIHTLHELEAS